ncbi:hypothetical protein [Herbaspirillum frisingense]|uniref:hypothetical protein n=1 Tax=Herbaspirillum frisingense TaxID=92645 RepID=UPI0039B0F417
MEKRFLNWLGFGMLFLAIIAVGGALIRDAANIVDSHQKGGDLATWIGAVGTVGTLIGTIFLANRETYLRQRQEIQIAQLKLTGLHDAIATFHAEIFYFRQLLSAATTDETAEHMRKDQYDSFKALSLWTVEELMPLTSLQNDLALRLARTLGARIQILDYFQTASRLYSIRNFPPLWKEFLEKLEQTEDDLQIAKRAAAKLIATTPGEP